MTVRLRRGLAMAFAATLTTAIAFTPGGAAAAAKPPSTMPVQMLAINDFHGNLEPPTGSSGTVTSSTRTARPPGDGRRCRYLSTALKKARAGKKTRSPSGRRHGRREPAAVGRVPRRADDQALNAAGHGRRRPSATTSSTRAGRAAAHAERRLPPDRRLLRAGPPVPRAPTSRTCRRTSSTTRPTSRCCRRTAVKNVGGAQVGFIGVTLKGTPDIVTPPASPGSTFKDEVETVNHYAELQTQGVKAIVALVHQGGVADRRATTECDAGSGTGLTGDIVRSPSARPGGRRRGQRPHPHSYACDIPDPAGQPRLVTSAASFGRLVHRHRARYDKHTTTSCVVGDGARTCR